MVGGVDTVGMTGLVSMDTIGMVPMSTSAVKVDIADVIEKVGMVSTSRMRIGATISSIGTIGVGLSSSMGAGMVKMLGVLLSVVTGHTPLDASTSAAQSNIFDFQPAVLSFAARIMVHTSFAMLVSSCSLIPFSSS